MIVGFLISFIEFLYYFCLNRESWIYLKLQGLFAKKLLYKMLYFLITRFFYKKIIWIRTFRISGKLNEFEFGFDISYLDIIWTDLDYPDIIRIRVSDTRVSEQNPSDLQTYFLNFSNLFCVFFIISRIVCILYFWWWLVICLIK